MIIHKNFTGGNIEILKIEDNDVYLDIEYRDTKREWLYFAFCVEGAENQKVTFHFKDNRLGYYGPAISHDLQSWKFLRNEQKEENSFTYEFKESENKVYFAHSFLYHPERFLNFASNNDLEVKELTKTKKNRSVPYIEFGYGKLILLTSRHHCCESTGTYVLEGVLRELLEHPLIGYKIICIPFVDMDGVIDGDQGKDRFPHDHNRDYSNITPCIYPETNEIKNIIDNNDVYYAFDFHSPYHWKGLNDHVFIVQGDDKKLKEFELFGELFEETTSNSSLKFHKEITILPNERWNDINTPTFAHYARCNKKYQLAFTLETTYFGLENNKVSQENLVELGRNFVKSFKKYLKEKGE